MNRASAFAVRAILALLWGQGCGKAMDSECQNPRLQAESSARVAAAQADAESKTTFAKAQADREVAEARARFVRLRDYFRAMTSKLFAVDRKLAQLEERAKTPAGRVNAELEGTLQRLHAGRVRFTSDFEALEAIVPSTWEATKDKLDRELSDLQTLADDA